MRIGKCLNDKTKRNCLFGISRVDKNNKIKMASHNGRFGASGAVAHSRQVKK